jgi:hypothetical protein
LVPSLVCCIILERGKIYTSICALEYCTNGV